LIARLKQEKEKEKKVIQSIRSSVPERVTKGGDVDSGDDTDSAAEEEAREQVNKNLEKVRW